MIICLQITGITVAEWCERNNVTEKSYWYYHKLLGDELAHTVSEYGSIEKFLPISSCDDSTGKPIFEELRQPGQDSYPEKQKVSAVIHKNGLKIEITDSITDELLIRIIKAVSHV